MGSQNRTTGRGHKDVETTLRENGEEVWICYRGLQKGESVRSEKVICD